MSESTFRGTLLRGVEALQAGLRKQGDELATLKSEHNEMHTRVNDLRRQRITGLGGGVRVPGRMSDEGAIALARSFLSHVARTVAPEMLGKGAQELLAQTRALTTSEIPLPTQYGRELIELITEFGVVRRNMRRYPMSGAVDKPPRMGTRPAFQSIAMAAPFPELKPTLGFASLEPHKVGGIVIPPREITEQSAVDFGNYLAMYGAVEFARAEDTWGFLADGTATYESVSGICKVCTDNNLVVTTDSGKTAPSDTTLTNFRNMRGEVSTAALSGGKYYINQSMEQHLRSFNTTLETPFVYRPSGQATLDGFPIVWTEVLQAYSTAAQVNKYVAAFGRLEFWWFGEHESPRVDTSSQVYFANDLIATRFIEEIDFDYAALDSVSVLRLAAN